MVTPPKVVDVIAPKNISFVNGVSRKDVPGSAPKASFIRRLINRLIAPGMTLMLARRMQKYGVGFFESFRAAKALRGAMEQTGVKKDPSQLLVAFGGTFKKLLADPSTDAFLGKLESALSTGGAVDVWMIAVKHFRSERAALGALSVLFQDTSGLGAQVQYVLADPKLKALQPQAARLGVLCAKIADPAVSATLLPPQSRNAPESRAYHFLVMAEVAARLKEAGFSTRASGTAPYALNTACEEYQTQYATKAQPDGITALMMKPWRAIREVFFPRDPKTFNKADTGGLSDLYLGYAGATYGVGTFAPIAYKEFAGAFCQSPKQFSKIAFP